MLSECDAMRGSEWLFLQIYNSDSSLQAYCQQGRTRRRYTQHLQGVLSYTLTEYSCLFWEYIITNMGIASFVRNPFYQSMRKDEFFKLIIINIG